MNAVDTNVFVYSLDRNEPVKRAKAWHLLRGLHAGPTPTVLLWQVAAELVRQLRTWQDQGRVPVGSARRHLRMARYFFPLTMPTPPFWIVPLTSPTGTACRTGTVCCWAPASKPG